MRRSPTWIALIVPLALVGCGLDRPPARRAPALETAAATTPTTSTEEIRTIDRDIAFYQQRVAEDPTGGLDLAALAGLYMQRGRVTGNPVDYQRAEESARLSERRQPSHNGKAEYIIAASLLAQHRFTEAGQAACGLCAADPEVTAYRGLLGEIQLELGQYAEADSTFAPLADSLPADAGLETVARLARWDELHGRTVPARARLEAALARARQTPNLSAEQSAWFTLRLGDFDFRHGRTDAAEMALRAGLARRPDDRRLLVTLCRLEAARHNWAAALRLGEQAEALLPEPATLVALGEARLGAGDRTGAEACFRKVEQAAFDSPFNRVATTMMVDHERRLPEVLARLRKEIGERHDVGGYDLLGWALYRSGDYAAADRMAKQALGLGTEDALMEYHAGRIALALGRSGDACSHLERALELNPLFHPLWADSARAVLRAAGSPPYFSGK